MKFSDLINQNLPVIIDFYAEWCGPCKMMAPMMEQVKEDYSEKIKIYKIDIDRNKTLAEKYNIQAVPTLMIFKNGKQHWRVAGVPGKSELKRNIDTILN
jgi:thioredoxin 1